MKIIKWRFNIALNEQTGNFHIVFDDLFAGRKLIVPLMALLSFEEIQKGIIRYEHNGGFANSIVVTYPDGVNLWNEAIGHYVWLPEYQNVDNKKYFVTDYNNNLIVPPICSICGAKNPAITETIVANGRAVKTRKLCSHHSEYEIEELERLGYEG